MLVHEGILPLLNTEYAKYWPNKLPDMFEYTQLYVCASPECGCFMTLKLAWLPCTLRLSKAQSTQFSRWKFIYMHGYYYSYKDVVNLRHINQGL